MSEKKGTFNSRTNRLDLTTPRRKLKILSSLLDAEDGSKTQDEHSYSSIHGNKHKVAKPTRQPTLRESISSRRNSHIHNKSLHEDSAKALNWVDSLINRGKSILTTLEKEDALFERELEEERQRFQLHDSLMNKYTGNGKSHQRLVDLRKSQYGTDTSFQNNDEIPLDSFISSPLPEADDKTPSSIDSDEDEDLQGKESLIKDFDLENDESDLSGEEENTDDQSSASIVILSDEEYAEEGALQDISSEDEYEAHEEEQVEMEDMGQGQTTMRPNVESATQTRLSNPSDHQDYSETVEKESDDDNDVESGAEKDESQEEEGTEHSIDFSKYMQPRIDNTKTLKYQPDEQQTYQTYSENDTFDSGPVNISVDDDSEDEESQAESYLANAGSVRHNEQELDNKELIENIESLDSGSESAQESERGNEGDFEYKATNGKESALEETKNTSESEDQSFEIDTKDEMEQHESGEESEKNDSIKNTSVKDFYENNNEDEYLKNSLNNDMDSAKGREKDTVDGKDYEVIGNRIESNLRGDSPDNLYNLAARAVLQFQQSKNLNCPQKEEKESEFYTGHSNRIDVSDRSSDELEEQLLSEKDFTGKTGNENVKVDRDDSPPCVEIEVEKASETGRDPPAEKKLLPLSTDTTFNDLPMGNEDSVYYSLDDADVISENLANTPLLETKPISTYEVVISGSVYSSTSYEDNAVVMPPQVEYISPFMNDPFNSSNGDCEKKHELLKSTLAALAPAFIEEDAKVGESGATESYLTSKSGCPNAFHIGEEIDQMSNSDETTKNASSGNENAHNENKNQNEVFPTMTTTADKSAEDNADEKYFSAINYTNITEDSSFQETIEPALDVEEYSRLHGKDTNKVEISTGDKHGKQNEDGSITQRSFATDFPDNYQQSNNGPDTSSAELKVKHSDLGEESFNKGPANVKVHSGTFEDQNKEGSSPDSLLQETAASLEVSYGVVDSERKCDEEHVGDPYEKGYADPESSYTGNSKESTTKGMRKDAFGLPEPENETVSINHEDEILFEANVCSSVDVQNKDIPAVTNREAEAKYEEGERKHIIEDINSDEAHISIIEKVGKTLIENNTEILEKPCVEEMNDKVYSKRRATTIEGTTLYKVNTNMHDVVNQASHSLDREQGRKVEKNTEVSAKVKVEIPAFSSELESVQSLKPESAHSNIFSSPIRVLGTMVKGVGKVVDLAESFVKKIDVMDSESDDSADIDDGNEEMFENSVTTNVCDDMKSIIIEDKDGDEDEVVTLGGVTTKAPSGNGNFNVINIDAVENGNNEEDIVYDQYSDIFGQQMKDKKSSQKSEESLVENLQCEQHSEKNDHSEEEEEEDDPIDGEATSANTHVSGPDDIKRQQLLKNLIDLENYSQKLTQDSSRGTSQEKRNEINTSREQDPTFERPVEEEHVGVIEEDSVSELDISIQSTEHEEYFSKKQERSIEDLHSEPEEDELFELERQVPTGIAVFGKSDDEERQRGTIPSTDLPSDPPSDREESTGSHTYSNSENASAGKGVPTSPEVYEIFSDTPNELPMEINNELPNTSLGKDDKTTATSVLDDRLEDLSSNDKNFINIKVNEGEEGSEHKAVDIPIEVDVKEEQEEIPPNPVPEEQKLNEGLFNDKGGLGSNNDEEINREEDKSKAKKKSRKRNYNSRRRKRKITEGSSAASNTKRRKRHEPRSRGKKTDSSVNK
ncbi:Esc1p [Saccharomyces paradoxus]|uniref:Esc1p n=1 Tax=Saccharomyces paradoxus TaxID=27291 RepID=A0A8B8UXN5_SACPA|nr:Esc1 [Saccharomyces paradoxus]QHS75490.1 Esc1 [Saccharomyces paradoxus]